MGLSRNVMCQRDRFGPAHRHGIDQLALWGRPRCSEAFLGSHWGSLVTLTESDHYGTLTCPRDIAIQAGGDSMDVAVNTEHAGSFAPSIAQLRSVEEALGLGLGRYPPLARFPRPLPWIRTRDVDPQGVESDEGEREHAAVLPKSEPPLLGPSAERVTMLRGRLNPWNIDPKFCPQ